MATTELGILIYALFSLGILYACNQYVQEPYMDEIFHYRQTKQYCDGDFVTWDPKITTFPGLYLCTTLFSKILSYCISNPNTLQVFRTINVIFNLGSLYILFQIQCLKEKTNRYHAFLHAITLAFLPIHFFCSFLYYTDSGSTFFVLLMYFYSQYETFKQKSPLRSKLKLTTVYSALAGAVAVGFRQTNIVWVLFVLGSCMVADAEHSYSHVLYKEYFLSSKKYEDLEKKRQYITKTLPHPIPNPIPHPIRFIQVAWMELSRYLVVFSPYLLIVGAFSAFLLINQSIVVGDHSNHKSTIHIPQLFYFALFSSTFLSKSFLQPTARIQQFLKECQSCFKTWKHRILGSFLLVALLVVIAKNSIVHPFILADNRHYTFYIWKNWFLRYSFGKYLLLPVYMYCIWLLHHHLVQERSRLWILVYLTALSLALLPSPLVEFRYYIVGYMILLSNVQQTKRQLGVTLVAYVLVNVVTIYIFIAKPFQWNDGSVARFMW